MANTSYFEKIGHKVELYENEVEDSRLGPYQARTCKEHLVSSKEGRGITYYYHYYKNRWVIKLAPYQPQIGSQEEMEDIDPRSLDGNYRMSISKAEALVAKYPNRSQAWKCGALSYFHYEGLHKAKLFLRRGINTVDSREHHEKLILWKSLILIEARCGSREEMLAVFEEALKHNNNRKLCFETLSCLNELNETKAFEIITDRILLKFKTEKVIYLVLGAYHMKKGAKEKVKDLLERGLKYVPPKEHPDLLRKFSKLEKKFGA